jgi:hypothetical protein
MGSTLYAELLEQLGYIIAENKSSIIGQALLSWLGTPKEDAIALRFVAALHYRVITVADKGLQAIFPPRRILIDNLRESKLRRSIERHQDFIVEYLRSHRKLTRSVEAPYYWLAF